MAKWYKWIIQGFAQMAFVICIFAIAGLFIGNYFLSLPVCTPAMLSENPAHTPCLRFGYATLYLMGMTFGVGIVFIFNVIFCQFLNALANLSAVRSPHRPKGRRFRAHTSKNDAARGAPEG